MTADRTDDILGLLEEIHGDGLSRREATVNDAVGQIERSAYRGYNALRDLAQRGTPRLPAHADPKPAEFTEIFETPKTPKTPETPESGAEYRDIDASEAETRIAARPSEPEKPRNTDPIDVISGDGANFRERGHTQTHIIRRPRNWFGRR